MKFLFIFYIHFDRLKCNLKKKLGFVAIQINLG